MDYFINVPQSHMRRPELETPGLGTVTLTNSASEPSSDHLFNHVLWSVSVVHHCFLCFSFRGAVLQYSATVEESLVMQLQHVFAFLALSQVTMETVIRKSDFFAMV